jgi:hypothetical protein
MKRGDFLVERLDRLFYWVREREAIRKKKEAGEPKPWTDNAIMQTTRFCCVRRMDDKVSRWLVDNWYTDTPDKAQILCNAGMARLINWPDSLAYLIEAGLNKKWDQELAREVLYRVREKEGKVFTGVYIITGKPGQNKVDTVIQQFDDLYTHADKLVDTSSMRATHSKLQLVRGIGSFIGGQLVADLRHVMPGTWLDMDTWAPLGPGSRRGIAWLMGWNGVDTLPGMKQEKFEELLTALIAEMKANVGDVFDECGLEAHDVQNVLCETDKFMRLSNGTGRCKNKYPGQVA